MSNEYKRMSCPPQWDTPSHTPSRMAIIKKKKTIMSVAKDVGKPEPPCIANMTVKRRSHHSLAVPQKVKRNYRMTRQSHSRAGTLKNWKQEPESTCTCVLAAALFVWKTIQMFYNGWWASKMRSVPTVECYSALKRTETDTCCEWVNLEDMMLSEVSQKQRDEPCPIPLTWGTESGRSHKDRKWNGGCQELAEEKWGVVV